MKNCTEELMPPFAEWYADPNSDRWWCWFSLEKVIRIIEFERNKNALNNPNIYQVYRYGYDEAIAQLIDYACFSDIPDEQKKAMKKIDELLIDGHPRYKYIFAPIGCGKLVDGQKEVKKV